MAAQKLFEDAHQLSTRAINKNLFDCEHVDGKLFVSK